MPTRPRPTCADASNTRRTRPISSFSWRRNTPCAPTALKATNYGIAPKLEGDIKQIVPPILKMSRKLQQDPEYLKTHPWFAYLKPLPKADQMWEGNKKIQ